MSYWRFAMTIATPTVVMFGLMYQSTYLLSHLFWSETRVYMALLMGATMAIVMLAFMLSMYSNKTINAAIFAGAAILFASSLWLVRSQVTVGDTSFMRAMIPHHSGAIMTSSRANLVDSRVRELADEIVFAQDKEIAEMRYLINEVETSGAINEPVRDEPAGIVDLDQALSSAEMAILNPGLLTEEEIAQLLPNGAACTFNYTTSSPPVLAIGPQDDGTAALVKISGDLVRLDAGTIDAMSTGPNIEADGVSIHVRAPSGTDSLNATPDPQDANLVLNLEAGLSAGYRGFYSCTK